MSNGSQLEETKRKEKNTMLNTLEAAFSKTTKYEMPAIL
jgi:hypothetical protein